MKNLNDFWKRNWKAVVAVLLIGIFAEVVIFNFRSLESIGLQMTQQFQINYGEDSQVTDGNTVWFSDSNAEIELTRINQELENMLLDITVLSNEEQDITLGISAIDEGSELYYQLPWLELDMNQESDKFIKLNLNGKVDSLKLYFDNLKGSQIQVNTIGLNVSKPMVINPIRVILVISLCLVLYLIWHFRKVFSRKFQMGNPTQNGICIALAGIQIVLVIMLVFSAEDYVEPIWEHHYQYENLAKSMAEGHFYLDEEPSQQLKDMDNPYDTQLREEQQVPFVWDQTYYNGKYYVYFGVTPVLVFYLPYYVLTGSGFPTVSGIIICELALILGMMCLLNHFIRRFFKKVTLGGFLLLDILIFLGSGSLIIAKVPSFYSLPIIMGMALSIWGWYFWSRAVSGEHVRWGSLALGSVCLALVAGCRPQMLLSSAAGLFLIAPPLYRQFKENKRKILPKLCGCALPFVIVALFLMYYNYARFGSPFDFGANYNLTTNDMTKRGFRLDRLPLGLYMFFLQPPAFNTVFPFMENVNVTTYYQGITIYERMYGGLLMLNPFLWSGVLFNSVRKSLKQKKMMGFVLASMISGVVIVVADIEMAGILMRYMCDFALFLCIPTAMIILEYMEQIQDGRFYLFFHKMLAVVTGVTVILFGLYLCV